MNTPNTFRIEHCADSGVPAVKIINAATGEFFSVLPSAGGRLNELCLGAGTPVPVLCTVDVTRFDERDALFANAKLFPFPGRLRNGLYEFGGRAYRLPLNYADENNAAHGFFYNREFSVVGTTVDVDRAECVLRHEYDGSMTGYPFPCIVEIRYMLTVGSELICETGVHNRSEVPMPVADGWHFNFNIGEVIDGLRLGLDVASLVEFDARTLPTGRRIMRTESSAPVVLRGKTLDALFQVAPGKERISTRLISGKKGIELELWQETGPGKYNYLVVYTPSDRSSIAVEPWSANADAFNNGEGLIILTPSASATLRCGVKMNIC